MDSGNPASHADLQLLGEIEAPIVPGWCVRRVPATGEPVFFAALRQGQQRLMLVEDALGEPLGHLPRGVSCWLGELLGDGRVELTGYKPARSFRKWAERDHRLRVRIAVMLTPSGQQILEPRCPTTTPEALHQVVLAAYQQTERYTRADLVLELADGLRPLACQRLLPETRLLLALLPGVAREIRHVEAMHRQLQPGGNHRPSRSGASQLTQVTE